MTQYNLNYKGSDVDLAIEKSLAHLNNIDTTPSSPSTKAVTSEGIKAALDGKLASSDIITNLNSPNNTTVPSTLAVTNGDLAGARYTVNTLTDYNPPDTSLFELDLTEPYDPTNICTLDNNSSISINGGTGAYLIGFSGEYRLSAGYGAGTAASTFTYRYQINGHVVFTDEHRLTTQFRMISHTHIFYLSDNDVIRITGQGGGANPHYIRISVRNAGVFIKKLTL